MAAFFKPGDLFKPGDQCLAADAKDTAHAAQGSPLVVSSQHLGLEVLAVASRFGVLAAASLASVAEVFLLAVIGKAVTAQAVTAAVNAKDCYGNHHPV